GVAVVPFTCGIECISAHVDMAKHDAADRDSVEVQAAQRISDIIARRGPPSNKEQAMISEARNDRGVSNHQNWRRIDDNDVVCRTCLFNQRGHPLGVEKTMRVGGITPRCDEVCAGLLIDLNRISEGDLITTKEVCQIDSTSCAE